MAKEVTDDFISSISVLSDSVKPITTVAYSDDNINVHRIDYQYN